ncbi:MAG TPA: 1-deoxy-D-xylulose-5-phosphate synthase [Candidatus Latescibacteria bacterium]|jgi:1-deoxy-D-xylulose-5-phosphate synthase|nr:1-deoxy-D-xylulose-5-phosphate synthase [Gemmatimonadaceae bacterium]MDP6015301.1 1-deoxy-D-xylulose-5-phosphate synthase [Candidatus Latescibacterota bacterium]HJP32027.1 1-deoxy-D-xylulose-5-phosphate synthase [Candidatus Latescibacterota bacterium]
MSLLETIESPADLKSLTVAELQQVADELRAYIIEVVTSVGGHFGSSLGANELTVALHAVFDTPADRIVWDVGHQTYGHKVLTGRREDLREIRQAHGISGFPKRSESPYDTFGVGHAGTSISAALGFAAMRDHLDEKRQVIAVIGDGALTSGIALEGLNNAGATDCDLIVLLNDNRMSISPNVGGISHYLTRIISDPTYNRIRQRITNDPLYQRVRHGIWNLTGTVPVVGENLQRAIGGFEEGLKAMLVPGVVFEEMGFRYFGPIDGHDLPELVNTLQNVKEIPGPKLLHIHTIKGKGAIKEDEEDPYSADSQKYHALSPPKLKSGGPSLPRYQDVFGEALSEIAANDSRICAITAAMIEGTGLNDFAKRYPDRTYDVGIAEQHAVTFAAGMALEGGRPVVAIYSTFLQRAFDQIVHDVALQSIPVTFCLDRAGLVGEDGPTHHGTLDLSFLMCVPHMIIAAPKDADEMRDLLYTAIQQNDGPFAIRYPRDSVPRPATVGRPPATIPVGSWETLTEGHDVTLLATGTMVETSLAAARLLEQAGVAASVVNARFVKPMDLQVLERCADTCDTVVTIEENAVVGGFGSAIVSHLADRLRPGQRVLNLGLPDRFIEHGPRKMLLEKVGLTPEAIAEVVWRHLEGKASEAGLGSIARSATP